ncbi:methylenetetrahydrofolate reductase C-terminal domain-containing protein [Chloroflexota bacterium]
MKTITAHKPLDEVTQYLEKCQGVYIIGCGTCATLCHTGGKTEVLEMKKRLEEAGKRITGWMVIPTACDELTREAISENINDINIADCLLMMTCAFGVQTVNLYMSPPKPVYPALNTLFVGREESPGHFTEICGQCGDCILALTAGICPVVRCAKGLLNGPCGGSVEGKCEVSLDIPCGWQIIIERLEALGQLDKLEEIVPPRDWSTSNSGGPRQITIKP